MARTAKDNRIYLVALATIAALCMALAVGVGANTSQGPEEVLQEKAALIVSKLDVADYKGVASFVHEEAGLHFLPYTYDLGTVEALRFDKSELATLLEHDTLYSWGVFDGSGEPIKLSPNDYHKSFVFQVTSKRCVSVDVLVPEEVASRSEFRAVSERFPGSSFVIYSYEGSEEAAFNDWRSLVLVFNQFDDDWFLLAIGNGEKTI